MQTIAVIDFETSGLGPANGGRATEIAAVLQLTSVLGIHTMSMGAPILLEEAAARNKQP